MFAFSLLVVFTDSSPPIPGTTATKRAYLHFAINSRMFFFISLALTFLFPKSKRSEKEKTIDNFKKLYISLDIAKK